MSIPRRRPDHQGHRHGVRLGLVAGLVATVLVAAPATVEAAAFVSIPDRLYMVPAGGNTSLPPGIPGPIVTALTGIKVGTLPFDGSEDFIVQDKREIVVTATEGPNGCDLVDEPAGETDYDIDDCTRLILSVNIGRIRVQNAQLRYRDFTTDPPGPAVVGDDNPADWVWRFPDGAVLDSFGGGDPGTDPDGSDPTDPGNPNDPDGYLNLEINGDTDMLNAVLQTLVYIPPTGYRYIGENAPPRITVTLSGGDGVSPSDPHRIDIRVLAVNGFPTHTGPATFDAPAATAVPIPGSFTVEDEDNDEDVDGAQADPPVPGEDPVDGPGENLLLVGYLDCDTTPVTDTGVRFASADFAPIVGTLKDFLEPRLGAAGPFIGPALETLNSIVPGLADETIQTGDETQFTTFFAGVGTMAEVRAALSTVTFRHDTPGDTCTLYTIVSDLGNNGLPVQWLSDPAPDGTEIPMIGFDWNELEITTGDLQEIDISFDSSAAIFVNEGDAPVAVVAPLVITPAGHPGFTIHWDALPKSGDPIGIGDATPGADFSGTSSNTLTVPAGAETVPVPLQIFPEAPGTTVLPDTDPEPTETFRFSLVITPDDYPDGWTIGSATPTRTVVIKDDDEGPGSGAITAAVADVSINEGDAGTTDMEFDVVLTGAPATGFETIDYAVTDGTATTADNDYTATNGTLTFSPGNTQATITVPINGDRRVEANETLTLTLSNPNGLSFADPAEAIATGTITNDDTPSIVTINNTSIAEGTTGPITVSMTQPTGRTCTVAVTTTNLTAEDGDYTPLTNAPLTLNGVATNTINLTTIADADTDNETVGATITLTPNPDCQLGNPTATITITEPPPPGTITASVADVTVNEGDTGTTNMVFTVALSGGPAVGGETIDYTTSDGTATTADNDYTATNGTLTFSPGNTQATITVPINGDRRVEANETLTLTLTNASGITLTPNPATATGTITNDDTPSIVTINNTSIAEGTTGPITVSMTQPTGRTCTVAVTTTNLTAEDGDYTPLTNAPLTLNGVATNTINLTTIADADTDNETVGATITLTPNPDCQLGNPTATITITEPPPDDDPPADPLAIDVPDNIVRPNDPGQPGAVVTWPAPTTTGGTPPVGVVCTPASGSFFALGTTTVTCTANDNTPPLLMELSDTSSPVVAALSVADSFTVTVTDNEPPTIADLPDVVRSTPGAPVPVTFPLPAASDNSGVPPAVTCTPPSNTLFAVGVTTVTCTATDGAGNQASSTFTVTVIADTTSPVLPQQPQPQPGPAPSGPAPVPSGELPETGGAPGRLLLIATGLVLLGLILRRGRHSEA